MAINRAGVDVPGRLDHWVSMDNAFFIYGLYLRGRRFENGDVVPSYVGEVHTQWGRAEISVRHHKWKFSPTGGSSTLFALKVALVMGFSRIVLCGCPMDGQGHYYDSPVLVSGATYWDTESSPEWDTIDFQGKVRSMSGVTRERFGPPTTDWLRT